LSEDRPPARVRVTGPPRHQPSVRPRSRLGDVHEQTAIGGVYLRSLLREQLALAVGVLLAVGLTLGTVPLVFHVWPGLADLDIIGIPVAWALLGGLVYPFLLLLGWRYVRSVERNERNFADLVEGSGSERAP
jgi:hypothetical protein